MSGGADDKFVTVARFGSRLEAETIGHALDPHGIPFLVQSDDVGIFGPGMTGLTPSGAKLMVPANRRADVEELISCVLTPAEDEPEA